MFEQYPKKKKTKILVKRVKFENPYKNRVSPENRFAKISRLFKLYSPQTYIARYTVSSSSSDGMADR